MLLLGFIIFGLICGYVFNIFMKYKPITEEDEELTSIKLAGFFLFILFLLIGYIAFNCAATSSGAPADSRIELEDQNEK